MTIDNIVGNGDCLCAMYIDRRPCSDCDTLLHLINCRIMYYVLRIMYYYYYYYYYYF